MRVPSLNVLRVDLILQIPILLGSLLCYFMGIFQFELLIIAILLQLMIGVIQVGGAFLYIVVYSDHRRVYYFILSLGYVILLFLLGAMISSARGATGGIILFAVFVCLLPMLAALWYYRLTWRIYQDIKDHSQKPGSPDYDDDVLDDLML